MSHDLYLMTTRGKNINENNLFLMYNWLDREKKNTEENKIIIHMYHNIKKTNKTTETVTGKKKK